MYKCHCLTSTRTQTILLKDPVDRVNVSESFPEVAGHCEYTYKKSRLSDATDIVTRNYYLNLKKTLISDNVLAGVSLLGSKKQGGFFSVFIARGKA